MGGTCVNVGCVPKKLYVYASEFGKAFRMPRFWLGQRHCPLSIGRPCETTKRPKFHGSMAFTATCWRASKPRSSMAAAASSTPTPWQWASSSYSAEKILIATGGWPHIPDFPGSEYAISSNEDIRSGALSRAPGDRWRRLHCGGVRRYLQRPGCQVTQLYRGPLFLRGFDEDIRTHAAQEIAKTGVDLRFDVNVESISRGAADCVKPDRWQHRGSRCRALRHRAQGQPAGPGPGKCQCSA